MICSSCLCRFADGGSPDPADGSMRDRDGAPRGFHPLGLTPAKERSRAFTSSGILRILKKANKMRIQPRSALGARRGAMAVVVVGARAPRDDRCVSPVTMALLQQRAAGPCAGDHTAWHSAFAAYHTYCR